MIFFSVYVLCKAKNIQAEQHYGGCSNIITLWLHSVGTSFFPLCCQNANTWATRKDINADTDDIL